MSDMNERIEKQIAEALSGTLSRMLLGDQNRTDRGYLSLVRGGYPVNDDFFDFLSATPFRFYAGTAAGKEPTEPAARRAWEERRKENARLQAMAKNARAFASLVDAIPRSVGDWIRTGNTLDGFYRDLWLQFIDVPSAKPSPATQEAYAKARKALGYNDAADEAAIAQLQKKAEELDASAAAEADVLKQMSYQDAAKKVRDRIQEVLDRYKTVYAAYAEHRNKYQQAVADLNLQMNTDPSDDYQVRILRNKVSNALDDWQVKGNKAQFETAMAVVARVDGADLSKTVEGLKKRFDAVKELNDEAANPFVPVGLIPSNFHQKRDGWTALSLNSQQLRDSSAFDHKVTSSGSGAGIFWRSDSETTDTTTRVVTNASEKLTVSFELARVAIDRAAWFDTNLLTSTMWRWADYATDRRKVADGKVPPDRDSNLMLPMYATDVVVARNVRITLAMTESESRSLKSEITRSSRRGFWIFSSSGTETETRTVDTYEWASGQMTISFAGMHILGFVCDRLPLLPNPSF